jgi:hypothetical protein
VGGGGGGGRRRCWPRRRRCWRGSARPPPPAAAAGQQPVAFFEGDDGRLAPGQPLQRPGSCVSPGALNAHTHSHTHCMTHARARAHARTHAHSHTHTHMHTHTHPPAQRCSTGERRIRNLSRSCTAATAARRPARRVVRVRGWGRPGLHLWPGLHPGLRAERVSASGPAQVRAQTLNWGKTRRRDAAVTPP